MADRENYLYQAKLAEQAERYDEMVQSMKSLAKLDTALKVEERNLLSVGYKNVIGTRRASWRVINAIESKEKEAAEVNSSKLEIIQNYRVKIEKELTEICSDILSLLDESLIPNSEDDEAKVFYYKMKGDYYRYMAEFKSDGKDRVECSENALKAYNEASDVANNLGPTHPIRLGLALNFSVFYYEILNEAKKAIALARKAFDEAVVELQKPDNKDDTYKDSTLILQLLRDNLTLWTSEVGEEDGEEKPEPRDDEQPDM